MNRAVLLTINNTVDKMVAESEEETVSQELVEITASGEIFPAKVTLERPPFDHQQEAMKALDKMDNAYKAEPFISNGQTICSLSVRTV